MELRAKLGKDSRNSSRPPSTDAPWQKRSKGKSKQGRKRKRGGQVGHEGKFGGTPDQVDHIHKHGPKSCRQCQGDLEQCGQSTGVYESHYVYELPPIKPEVHEHRCLQKVCKGCGMVTMGALPADVPKGRYGPSVQAMVALIRGELRQSVRQTSAVISQIMHVPMSVGMVAKTQQQVSAALLVPYTAAMQYVQGQQHLNADETGWREEKKRAWLWVAVTALVTVFLIHKSRGAKAAQALMGAGYQGLLTTDRWTSYRWVAATQRQLCWSHLKRDFKSFLDYGAEAKLVGERLLAETRKMFRLWYRVRDGTLSRAEFQLAMKPVRRRMEALLEEGADLPCKKVRGMCTQILKLRVALFTFVAVDGIEPTNNAAERALRFAVLWRKGSFGSDSAAGSRFVERFLTVRATLRSQHRDVYAYLTAACQAALTHTSPPSLLPDYASNPLALAA